MLKLLSSLLVISFIAYGSVTLLIFFRQDKLIFYPELPSRALETTPTSIGLEYENISLETQDNTTIHGWFIPHNKHRAVVLFCHGNAGNISHRMETIALFHQLELSTLIFDYRGYGKSEGKLSEQGTYLDVEAAWQYLTKVKHYNPSEIIIWGRSLGAAIAAKQAVKENPVKGVILESTFTSVPDLGNKLYPLLPIKWISRYQYDVKNSVTQIHSPILIMHSQDDEIIPFEHGKLLYDQAHEPKTFIELSGGHNEYVHENYDRYIEELETFLRAVAQ